MQDDFVDFDPPELSAVLWTVEGEQAGDGRFVRQRAGSMRYGHVKVTVAPHPGVHCFRFVWRPQPGSLPLGFMRDACLAGVKEALLAAMLTDRPIAFVQVTVVDGSYHDVDTDELAVKIAASLAVRNALERATLVRV